MKKQEKEELKNIFKELKNDNKKAIEELYQKYNKVIYGIAFSILKNKEDSEDIVQTVFSKLYTINKEKLPQDKEASWLYTVTKNETLLFLRKKNNTFEIETIYDLEDKNNDIEKLIDRENYNNLISRLNDKEKEIVSLKIISNLSFDQISELLGEPTGTIKWRYYKAVYTLRILLSNLGMFVVTFILGVATFKETKKSAEAESEQAAVEDKVENTEHIMEDLKNVTSEIGRENAIEEDIIQENIITEEPIIENNVNYLGYGILSISSIFLLVTIIFAIILKKYQLKSRKRSSK